MNRLRSFIHRWLDERRVPPDGLLVSGRIKTVVDVFDQHGGVWRAVPISAMISDAGLALRHRLYVTQALEFREVKLYAFDQILVATFKQHAISGDTIDLAWNLAMSGADDYPEIPSQ